MVLGKARMAEHLEDRTLLSVTAMEAQIDRPELSQADELEAGWRLVNESQVVEPFIDHQFFAAMGGFRVDHPYSQLKDPTEAGWKLPTAARAEIEQRLTDLVVNAEPGKMPPPLQIIFADGRFANVSLIPATVDGQRVWQGTFTEVSELDAANTNVLVLDAFYEDVDEFEFIVLSSWEQPEDLVDSDALITDVPVFSWDSKFAEPSETQEEQVGNTDESLRSDFLTLGSVDPQTVLGADALPLVAAMDAGVESSEEPVSNDQPVADPVEFCDSEFAAATPVAMSEERTPVFEVSLETWIAEQPVALADAATAMLPIASIDAEMLLANLDPSTLSGSIAAPLEPVLEVASAVFMAVQTVGRSVLLALVGEGGGVSGPVADFVEPLLDLADVGQPPERWELRTVDAVLDTVIAQVVDGDRHFEIRNIGSATDSGGNPSKATNIALLTLPRHGSLEQVGLHPATFRYVPDPGFSGVDVFRFRMRSSNGATREGQVVISVSTESAQSGLRTANRPIELQLGNELHTSTVAAFEAFADWHHQLD